MGILLNRRKAFRSGGSFFLDDHPGSECAVSLREISSSFVGVDLIRVRESDGDTTETFTATEITDGTLTTFVGGGNDGFVVDWFDQSGNGNDFTQATAQDQPKIVSSGSLVTNPDGFPTMQGDGSGDEMLTATNASIVNNVTHAILVVGNYLSVDDFDCFASVGYGSSGTRRTSHVGQLSNGNSWAGGDDLVTPAGASMGTGVRLLSKTYDGTHEGFLDGSSFGTTTATINPGSATSVFAILAYSGGSPQHANANVTEAIFYLSDEASNIASMNSDINDFYSIY